MRLVIFVPLVARMYAIEVSRLAWPIFVFPVVCGWINDVLLQIKKFFLLVEIFLRLSPVQSLRGEICAARCFFAFDFCCCRLCSLRNKPWSGDCTTLLILDASTSSAKAKTLAASKLTKLRRSSSSNMMSIWRSSEDNLVMSSRLGLIARS